MNFLFLKLMVHKLLPHYQPPIPCHTTLFLAELEPLEDRDGNRLGTLPIQRNPNRFKIQQIV